MTKPIMTGVILSVFLVNSWVCIMPVRSVEWELPEQAALRGDYIIAVHLKSGDVVDFSARKPARIVGNAVVGDITAEPGERPVSKSIPLSEVKLVEVRRENAGMSFLASAGVLALIWLGFLLIP